MPKPSGNELHNWEDDGGSMPPLRAGIEEQEMTSQPPVTPFSTVTPALRLVYDATALAEWMFCPYRYSKTQIPGPDGMVWGWKSAIDLEFGGFLAMGCEAYKKGRLVGLDNEAATIAAARRVLEATWNDDGEPWGGQFQDMWHCLGTKLDDAGEAVAVPYRNSKGNRAKCPYSHKGHFFPGTAPSICGECGADCETVRQFVADNDKKNRLTLVRAVIWWCLSQPENLADGLAPYVFDDGTPAVELFLMAPLPIVSQDGERFILAGLIDDLSVLGPEGFVMDNKSTGKGLDDKFFRGYSPHLGLDTYDLLVSSAIPSFPLSGVGIDAIQVTAAGARTERHVFRKTDSQREEHLKLVVETIKDIERRTREGYFPMNKRNCWLCPMNSVCSLPPEERDAAMAERMVRRVPWNPMERD